MTRAVLKIGGGILRSREDLETLAQILKMNSKRENVLVVSALQGVTDALLKAYEAGADITEELRQKHQSYFDVKNAALERGFSELSELLRGKERTIERKERISSFGERLSSILVSEYLNSHGITSVSMNAEDCGIVADGRFENANCVMGKTKENFNSKVIPKIKGRTIVITGYYGIDSKGNVNTFGRGGSDYSAAVVAVAGEAQVLEIWKDVEGFMSADPRVVKDARKLDEITFEEAEELGYLGAKILHPRTMDVLQGSPVFAQIKSVLAPKKEGTRIVEKLGKERTNLISSIASKKGVAIATIKGGKMVDEPGVAADIFVMATKAGVSVDTIATSQSSISFTVDEKDVDKLEAMLKKVENKLFDVFEIKRGLAMIGVVGEEMARKPGSAAGIFTAVAGKGINVELISQAASGINITFMINAERAEDCVRAIHEEFRLGG